MSAIEPTSRKSYEPTLHAVAHAICIMFNWTIEWHSHFSHSTNVTNNFAWPYSTSSAFDAVVLIITQWDRAAHNRLFCRSMEDTEECVWTQRIHLDERFLGGWFDIRNNRHTIVLLKFRKKISRFHDYRMSVWNGVTHASPAVGKSTSSQSCRYRVSTEHSFAKKSPAHVLRFPERNETVAIIIIIFICARWW